MTMPECVLSSDYTDNVAPDGQEFCAGLPAYGDNLIPGSKTVCKGDSGGALLCNIDGQITFSGVLSRKKPYEESCGIEGHPGVFSDLYYFSEWIQTGALFKSIVFFPLKLILKTIQSSHFIKKSYAV